MLMQTGELRGQVGDRQHELSPGDIMVIPAYVEHYFEALSEASWIEVHGPGFQENPALRAQ